MQHALRGAGTGAPAVPMPVSFGLAGRTLRAAWRWTLIQVNHRDDSIRPKQFGDTMAARAGRRFPMEWRTWLHRVMTDTASAKPEFM
jgi:hypothetical protein